MTLYAKWSINQYNLTIVFNNGADNEVRTLDFNEDIVYPENVEKEGYKFYGGSPTPAPFLHPTSLWKHSGF